MPGTVTTTRDSQSFARTLRNYREAAGLSQEALAERADRAAIPGAVPGDHEISDLVVSGLPERAVLEARRVCVDDEVVPRCGPRHIEAPGDHSDPTSISLATPDDNEATGR